MIEMEFSKSRKFLLVWTVLIASESTVVGTTTSLAVLISDAEGGMPCLLTLILIDEGGNVDTPLKLEESFAVNGAATAATSAHWF